MMPNDPIILLSYVNTKLRDNYSSLEDLCKSEGADINDISTKLSAAGFEYDSRLNKFV